MSELRTNIYTRSEDLPKGLSEENFFHSPQLFNILKQTPRHKPYMVVVETTDGRVVAQMLATVRYRSSWFPPYLYIHCRVMGEGVYQIEDETMKTEHFPAVSTSLQSPFFQLMLQRLTERLGRRMLYFEVSNLSQKMFGYKEFRQLGFFPVRWMSIHNSLHSRTPEERIGPRMQKRINQAYERGIVTEEIQGDADFEAFSKLLHHHNWLKPKRYIPHDNFFKGIRQSGNGRLFVTRYRDHVVGCSAVVFSGRNAYLWYSAYRRKSFAFVHPDIATIWHAIKDAHQHGYDHIFFLDVGLPFRRNRFREFILRFGGKPVSTYRWFRTSIGWLNKLLSWFYRD